MVRDRQRHKNGMKFKVKAKEIMQIIPSCSFSGACSFLLLLNSWKSEVFVVASFADERSSSFDFCLQTG